MPKIAASIVFPVSAPPRRNAVVRMDDNGTVLSVSKGDASFSEMAGVEFYSGILIPGLVDLLNNKVCDNHRLVAEGVRVTGLIGDAGQEDMTWKSRYGPELSFRFFDGMDNFNKGFREGETSNVFCPMGSGGSLQALASRGRTDLLSLMFELQEGPLRYRLPDLITMATMNGAHALNYQIEAGAISPGMRPGLNIIEGVDISGMRLLPVSRLRRLRV
jgi:hypothetical protein